MAELDIPIKAKGNTFTAKELNEIVNVVNKVINNETLVKGDNESSGDNSAILITRELEGGLGSLGAHALRDETNYESDAVEGLRGYASFDSIPVVEGSSHFNHLHSFQSRPNFNGSDIIDAIRGFTYQSTITGDVDYNQAIFIDDYLGTGSVNQNVGLYIKALTKGNSNYAIFIEGSAPSFFGGNIQSNGTLQGANAKLTSLNGSYGSIISVDSSGNILNNANLTIINGVLSLKNNTTSKINATNTELDLDSVLKRINVNDVLNLNPSSTPSSPKEGDLYFDSTTKKARCYNGTTWNDLF